MAQAWPLDPPGWQQWYREVGEVQLTLFLLAIWDPVGAQGAPEAADEYEGYLGRVFPFVRTEDTPGLADELRLIEQQQMGIHRARTPDGAPHMDVAQTIIDVAWASTWLWAGRPMPDL